MQRAASLSPIPGVRWLHLPQGSIILSCTGSPDTLSVCLQHGIFWDFSLRDLSSQINSDQNFHNHPDEYFQIQIVIICKYICGLFPLQYVWMWIACSILSVSLFMMISSRCYRDIYPRMSYPSTELVLIPFRSTNKYLIRFSFSCNKFSY